MLNLCMNIIHYANPCIHFCNKLSFSDAEDEHLRGIRGDFKPTEAN